MLLVYVVLGKNVTCGPGIEKHQGVSYDHADKVPNDGAKSPSKSETSEELYPGDKLVLIEKYNQLKSTIRRKRHKTIFGYGKCVVVYKYKYMVARKRLWFGQT